MLMIKKKGQRSEIIQTILQCLQLGVQVHIDQLIAFARGRAL